MRRRCVAKLSLTFGHRSAATAAKASSAGGPQPTATQRQMTFDGMDATSSAAGQQTSQGPVSSFFAKVVLVGLAAADPADAPKKPLLSPTQSKQDAKVATLVVQLTAVVAFTLFQPHAGGTCTCPWATSRRKITLLSYRVARSMNGWAVRPTICDVGRHQ